MRERLVIRDLSNLCWGFNELNWKSKIRFYHGVNIFNKGNFEDRQTQFVAWPNKCGEKQFYGDI